MKKFLVVMVGVLLLAACATSEERAARQAENLKMVKASVGHQKYRISVTEMTPMRGTSRTVMGHWLTVDSNMVDCMLPYVGRDDIPHMKTRGEVRMDSKIEFRAETRDYVLRYQPKQKSGVVTFSVDYRGDVYKFRITIDSYGTARIRMTPPDRDYIDYEGSVSPMY